MSDDTSLSQPDLAAALREYERKYRMIFDNTDRKGYV